MRHGSLVALLAGLMLVAFGGLCRADDEKKSDDKKSDAAAKPGFLGVMIDNTDDGKVVVREVVPNSPAEKAGLKAGDMIMKVGKEEVKDANKCTEIIRGMKAGDKVSLEIKRDGKDQTIDVTLGERTED